MLEASLIVACSTPDKRFEISPLRRRSLRGDK
jgi:hypothetical protein